MRVDDPARSRAAAGRRRREAVAVLRGLVVAVATGLLVGAAFGLVIGLADPAWAAYSMFLGALAGACAAACGSVLGVVVDRLFRSARAGVRRVAVSAATGLGAAGALLWLAQVWHVVPPWSTLGPPVVLALVSALTFRRLR